MRPGPRQGLKMEGTPPAPNPTPSRMKTAVKNQGRTLIEDGRMQGRPGHFTLFPGRRSLAGRGTGEMPPDRICMGPRNAAYPQQHPASIDDVPGPTQLLPWPPHKMCFASLHRVIYKPAFPSRFPVNEIPHHTPTRSQGRQPAAASLTEKEGAAADVGPPALASAAHPRLNSTCRPHGLG